MIPERVFIVTYLFAKCRLFNSETKPLQSIPECHGRLACTTLLLGWYAETVSCQRNASFKPPQLFSRILPLAIDLHGFLESRHGLRVHTRTSFIASTLQISTVRFGRKAAGHSQIIERREEMPSRDTTQPMGVLSRETPYLDWANKILADCTFLPALPFQTSFPCLQRSLPDKPNRGFVLFIHLWLSRSEHWGFRARCWRRSRFLFQIHPMSP